MIPRLSLKPVQNEDSEQIWIRGIQHDRYVPEPVFLEGGEENDQEELMKYRSIEILEVILTNSFSNTHTGNDKFIKKI